MSSSNSSIEKSLVKSCLDCENYKRKVIEAEQTVSGRDVLIEMLQGEIKKLEDRYKSSIDDYELLRFKFCTVVQELSNLKEIQRKLEKSNLKLTKERDFAKKELENLQIDLLESCKTQCKELTIELIPNEGVEISPSDRSNTLQQNILKEVMNIEVIMQNQNETVKDVLRKVLNEMKGDRIASEVSENLEKVTAYNTQPQKNMSYHKKDLSVTDLLNQLETLKAENESIKAQLREKKSKLAQCLDALENNHSNLNNLSGNIEMILNEKETYLREIGQLKTVIDEASRTLKQKEEEIIDLKNKLDSVSHKSEENLIKENKDLQKALNECERELEQLQEEYLLKTGQCTNEKCKTLGKAKKTDRTETIITTTVIGTILQANPTQSKAMNEAPYNNEAPYKNEAPYNYEAPYKNEATYKNEEKVYGNNNEDEDTIPCYQYEVEITVLNEKVKTLEENLKQANLKLSEYEDENKYYSQKVNSLVMHLQALEKEKSEQNGSDHLNKDEQEKELKDKEIGQMAENLKVINHEKMKLIEEREYLKNQIVNLQTEIMYMREKEEIMQEKIKKLEKSQNNDEGNENSKVAQLIEERDELENQVVILQQEILKKQKDETQLILLQENLKAANREISKLFEEKEHLKKQTVILQKEITGMQEKGEKQILMLQEKIDNLESTQTEKQKEIEQCCCVVRNIKAVIEDKNFMEENNFAQLTFLEDQNHQLQQQVASLKSELADLQKTYKGCTCTNQNYSTPIMEDEIQKLQQLNDALRSELIAYQNKYRGCNCTGENVPTEIFLLKDENQKLQLQIQSLKSELINCRSQYKGHNPTSEKYETENNSLGSINSKLRCEIKELETELCRQECLAEKLQNDNKDMETEICRRQCTINHLEQCLDNSNKILAECEREMKEMHADNENLKKQNESLKNDLKSYYLETKRASAEKEALQEEFSAASRKSQALELEKYQLSKNLQDKSTVDDELNQLRKQYDNLLKTTQEKDEELKSAKKKIEYLQQALEQAKKEHDKIMGAYNDVKKTLVDEVKKYNEEAERMDKDKEYIKIDLKQEAKCSACLNVKEMTAIIMEKQRTIKALEEQNRELTSEGVQLKAYVTKLISDNKNLRKAVENMLSSLTKKLKNFTESEEKISLKSNELIVNDILNSLIDLEKNIVDHGGTCKEKCNCMSVIKSQGRNLSPCKMKCGKKIKGISKCVGVNDACVECCQGNEKSPDDQPQSYSHGAVGGSPVEDFVIEPSNSSI